MNRACEQPVSNGNSATDPAARLVAAGAAAFVFLILGMGLLFFGLNLSPGSSLSYSVADHFKSLEPTPAMLQKLEYKIAALALISRISGTLIALLSFAVLYMTLKGADIAGAISSRLQKAAAYLGGRRGIASFMFIAGAAMLSMSFFSVLFTSAGFFLKIPVSAYHIQLAAAAAAMFMWLLSWSFFKDRRVPAFFAGLVVVSAVMAFSAVVSSAFYDTAFDGQAYHQENMIYMAEGWNPVYQNREGDVKYPKVDQQVYTTSKAAAMVASNIYKLTGNPETGKAFNIVLIFSSLFLSMSALLSFNPVKAGYAFLLSVLISLNPVSVYQSLSFYVDGQMSSVVICCLALFVVFARERDLLSLSALGMSVSLLAAIKLSGLAYAFFICAGIAAYVFFYISSRDLFRVSAVFLAFGALSFFCFSFNPFVTNHVNHGHIFHPFYGPSAISVVNHGPAYIVGMNNLQKAFFSVFSESENYYAGRLTEPRLKFPLRVSAREAALFAGTDTRVGGFGPLFAASLILSALLLAYCSFSESRRSVASAAFALFIILTALAIPEAWWARFVPQLFLAVFPALVLSAWCGQQPVIWIRRALLAVLTVNLLLVSLPYYLNQGMSTLSLSAQFREMKQLDKKLAVYLPFFSTSLGKRLSGAGIDHVEVNAEYFTHSPKMSAADFSVIYYDVMGKKGSP